MTTPVCVRQRIRQLDRQGLSHKEISRKHGVSRTTVVKYANHGDYSPRPSNAVRPGRSLVDDGYAAIVDGWPAADLRMPVKQRHTAARVYERLMAECGFTGSYSSVQRWVKRWRQERRSGTTLILMALYRSSCTLVYSPLKYRGGWLWREECPKAVVLKRI